MRSILILPAVMLCLLQWGLVSQTEIDWTGEYSFEKQKGTVTYTYIILLEKLSGQFTGSIRITGASIIQNFRVQTKTEKNRIYLLFDSYKEYDVQLFSKGELIAVLERGADEKVIAYLYGIAPLKKKKVLLKEGPKPLLNLPEGMTLHGYIETYYAWDTDRDKSFREYSATSPYRDEFRLNIAELSGSFESKYFRSNLGIHFGDIPNVNWPGIGSLQFIQKANIGFSPYKGVWFDFGYFLSHIGSESILPRKNFLNTLALTTFYQPIYQSGISVSYESKRFYSSLFVVNGFDKLTDNNKNKSYGLQIGGKPFEELELTYNILAGNEESEIESPKTGMYNNFAALISAGKKVDIVLNADMYLKEKSDINDSFKVGYLYSGFLSIRYRPVDYFSATARVEYHNDENGILSNRFYDTDSTYTGLKAMGLTLGFEYRPVRFAYLRLESRYLMADSKQKIFFDNKNSRFEVIFSTGAGF